MPTRLHTLAPPLSPLTSIVGRSITNPRVITGCALALGGMVAVGTGSIALLSTVAGVRGYLANRGLKDQIQSARREVTSTGSLSRARVLRVSLATCALVWAILMMPWTSYAGELLISGVNSGSLTQTLGDTSPWVATPRNHLSWVISEQASILDTSKIAWSVLPSISDISADILADHPGRSWISLEQMVRRIDGLEAGVGLSDTNTLVGRSLHETIYSESSPMYAILSARGYDLSGWVDSVCRKLSFADIESIAGEYRESLSTGTIGTPEVSPMVEQDSLTPAGLTPSSESNIPHSLTLTDTAPLLQAKTHDTLNALLLGVLGVGLIGGIMLYNRRRKIWRSTIQLTQSREPEQTESHFVDTVTTPDKAPNDSMGPEEHPQWVALNIVQKSTPKIDSIADSNMTIKAASTLISATLRAAPEFTLTPDLTEVMTRANTHYSDMFWWTECPDETVSTPNSITAVHKGNTLGGSFTAYTKYTSEGVQITIVWYDHGAARQHVQSSVSSSDSLLSTENPQITLANTLNDLYLQMLLKREWVKQDDLRWLQTVAVPRAHLERIYNHLDAAKIRSESLEVLGFWVASAYDIQDSTLPLTALTLPRLEELSLTRTSCTFANQADNRKYHFAGPNGFIHSFFPPKEAEFLINHRQKTQASTWGIAFSGAAMAYNWHKHPDRIVSPSGGDISEAIHDIDSQYPGRKAYLYTIAVRANTASSEGLPGVLRLPKDEYGGVNSYELRSYIMEYPHPWASPRMRRLAIALTP